MLYLVVFIMPAVFIAVLFFIKIKVALEYVRDDHDDNLVMAFYIMNGIFKYKYEIPLVDVGQNNARFRLVKETGKKEKKVGEVKKKLKWTEIYDKYINVKGYYIANNELICDIRAYLHKRLALLKFELCIREGTGNASQTAIISGILWSLTGIVTSFLSDNIKTLEKHVRIKPCFETKIFTVDFLCIFHIKFVHIIVVLMKIMKNRYKLKHKEKQEMGGGFSG